jgi:hypothetical protein
MKGKLLLDSLSIWCMFSPPFLLFFAWKRVLSTPQPIPKWRAILDWGALLSISALLVTFVVAFLTNNCNADLGDWSCVIRWRSFAGIVIRSSPVMILLALFGRKGTRILGALTVLAIDFDCILVDMMA